MDSTTTSEVPRHIEEPGVSSMHAQAPATSESSMADTAMTGLDTTNNTAATGHAVPAITGAPVIVEDAAAPMAAEAKRHFVGEGILGYKAPGGFLKKLAGYQKRFFWFGTTAIESKHLSNYMRGEKADVANHNAAWSSQTGQGLLYFSKHASERATPAGIINLTEVNDILEDGTVDFSFMAHGQKHAFQAANTTEREEWIAALKSKSIEARKGAQSITSSDGYKHEHSMLSKPAAAAGAATALGAASHKRHDKSEVREEKKELKALVKEEKVEAKEERKEEKAAIKEEKREEKAIAKEEKAAAEEEKKEEKIEAKAEKKEEKAAIKEEKREEKIEAKEEKKEDKAMAKEEKKEEKEVAKARKDRSASRKRNSIFGGFNLGSKKEDKAERKEEMLGAKDANVVQPALAHAHASVDPAVPTATKVPALNGPAVAALVMAAPVVGETTAAEANSTETRPMGANKRNSSFLGNLSSRFGTRKSVADEAPIVPMKDVTSEVAPATAEMPTTTGQTSTSEPLATSTTVPETTAPVEMTSAVTGSAVPEYAEERHTGRSDKRKSSLPFGLGSKKEKATSDSEGERALSPFAKLRATVKGKSSPRAAAPAAAAADEKTVEPVAGSVADSNTAAPLEKTEVPVHEAPAATEPTHVATSIPTVSASA